MRPRSPIGVFCLLSTAVLVLVLQTWLMRELRGDPVMPRARPLDEFPLAAGQFRSTGSITAQPELIPPLKADEFISRSYKDEKTGLMLTLLVSYYRTQSYLNQQYDLDEYLIDEGWSPLESKIIQLPQGSGKAVPIRYDLVFRGRERRLNLRWFETQERVLADGPKLHFYRVLDTVTHHRTDLAVVQIGTPVLENRHEQACQSALELAQQVVNLIRSALFRQ
jgi:EpsI family protein